MANLGGRPVGSTTKRQIKDYMSEAEVERMVNKLIAQAEERPELLKFLLEQVFGKARQTVGLDGGIEDGTIKPVLVKFINDNRDTEGI
jgi:hypothetical protein